MPELTKKQTTNGFVDFTLRGVAPGQAKLVQKELEKIRTLVETLPKAKDELISWEQAFPEHHVGTALAGARHFAEFTQARLAEKIGVKRHHISEMEHNKRPIGKNMAKRLAKALNTNYKVFL